MPILRCGNSIRLIGAEARVYLADTGRSSLPKTVAEYNHEMQILRELWQKYDTPDSRLLVAVYFKDLEPLP